MKSPIVFIHGWGTCSGVWKNQVDYFSKNNKVLTLDLRGHGDSPWQDADELLNTMASDVYNMTDEEVRVIGWSLGGMVAIKLAEIFPEKISKLILVGATPKFVNEGGYEGGLAKVIVKRLIKRLERDYEKALCESYKTLFGSSERGTRDFEKAWWPFMESLPLPNKTAACVFLERLCKWDLRPVLSRIKAPTLLISGDEDEVCPTRASRYIDEQLPDSRIRVFKGAGHVPFLTQADYFNSMVGEFLS